MAGLALLREGKDFNETIFWCKVQSMTSYMGFESSFIYLISLILSKAETLLKYGIPFKVKTDYNYDINLIIHHT